MSMASSILIIDDEPLMRISISDALRDEGYETVDTDSGRAGLDLLRERSFDVIITDLRLPEVDGLHILKACKQFSPKSKVILITAYGSVETAVEAMKQGAYDYITKPFSMDELLLMVKRLLKFKELEDENVYLREQIDGKYNFEGIIGKSPKMQEVFEKIKIVSQTDATILITGESGTGKELVANAIHYNSMRKNNPFVKVSCAALPETLLEAELFGHEKGAFTGALRQKKGRFELAHTGTLFLDEIGEITPGVQVKLLRVLQERKFERVGGIETIGVDVRIICATQRDLKKEVQKGTFREDLYYRLNVVPVYLPSLKERREDVLLLAEHFLKKFSTRGNKPIHRLSLETKELLLKYNFPGNVRELENAIERAVTLGMDEEINPWNLPEDIYGGNNELLLHPIHTVGHENLSKAREGFERQYILKVLEETKGNKILAATVLGISRKTLWEKCKNYGIVKK